MVQLIMCREEAEMQAKQSHQNFDEAEQKGESIIHLQGCFCSQRLVHYDA